METNGAFMISIQEYVELIHAKARLEVLKETHEKYGVVAFLETCERTFKTMDAEKGDVK